MTATFFGIPNNILAYIVWWTFVALVIFTLIRELITWYWKINRTIELLEKIEMNTRKENSVVKKEEQK